MGYDLRASIINGRENARECAKVSGNISYDKRAQKTNGPTINEPMLYSNTHSTKHSNVHKVAWVKCCKSSAPPTSIDLTRYGASSPPNCDVSHISLQHVQCGSLTEALLVTLDPMSRLAPPSESPKLLPQRRKVKDYGSVPTPPSTLQTQTKAPSKGGRERGYMDKRPRAKALPSSITQL